VRNDRFLRREDGTLVPVEMNTKMMPDFSYQTFIRDITERKLIEDALRASEQKFHQPSGQALIQLTSIGP